MIKSRSSAYLVTAAAVFALIILVAVFLALNAARLGTIFATSSNHLDAQNTSQIIYDDPLITYVPAGNRSAQQKTKVFVSSQDPIIGYDTAQVYVVFYGSLLDSAMQQYLSAAPSVQAEYGEKLAMVWKDHTTNESDEQAAVVGHCANAVGLFWEYAAALAESTVTDTAGFKDIAVAQGVNLTELEDCIATSGMSGKVHQSEALAGPLGVTTTHTVFVNDHTFTDSLTLEDLKQSIDDTLASF